MSILIGEDSVGSKVMHLTSDTRPAVDLKSGVLPSTVLHSTLPMVLCTVVPLPVVGTWTGTAYGHTNGTKFSTDDAFRSTVNAGTMLAYIGVSDTGAVTIISMRNWNGVYTSVYWVAGSSNYPYEVAPSADNYSPSLGYSVGIVESIYSEVYCVVSNIDFQDGYMPFVPTADSITITRDVFNIRGQDLRELVYLSNGTVNTVDYSGTTENTANVLQFVNSVYSSEPFTMFNDQSTGTDYIGMGSKYVFDTSHKSYATYNFSEDVALSANTYTFSDTYNTAHIFTLVKPIPVGSVVVIGGEVGSSTFVLPGFGVYNGADRIGYLDYYDGSIDGYTDYYDYTFEANANGDLVLRLKGFVESGYTTSNTLFNISIYVFS